MFKKRTREGEGPASGPVETGAPSGGAGAKRPSGRRRVLVRVGIGVLVAVVVLGVPFALSILPGWYARYPDVTGPYEAWSASSHAEVECYRCHSRPTIAARAVAGLKTVGDFGRSIASPSGRPGTLENPSNDACLDCHSDLRAVSPKGDLQIPHKAHVEILKMDCAQCHDRHMVHVPGAEGENTPPMEGCLECHDGDTADNACTACHTEKAAPDTHTSADWVIAHATHTGDPACEECHAWIDDWCVDCHSRRPRSHGDDWRATHRDRIAVHRSCEACHEGEFCVRCHGEVPQTNLDPDLALVR